MITPTQAQPQIFIPAPTDGDPPTNRCKKCKVPLPDATWKNCDSCRKNRTESYRRWKKSTEGRTRMKVFNASGPALPLEAQSSSAPAPRTGFTDVAPNKARHSMSSQVSRPFASHPLPLPSERNHNGLPTGPRPPPAPLDQLRSTSSSATPTNTVHIPEFQWSDELVGSLSELPPRSAFLGKFTVVADPAVGNANRAYMFADQLRARGILISKNSKLSTIKGSNPSNAYVLVLSCRCQEACHGRIAISVDDDVSHPYGVLGQRVAVAVAHS